MTLTSSEHAAGNIPIDQTQKPNEVNTVVDWIQSFGNFIATASCK